MLAIPLHSQSTSMAEIVSKEAQKKSKAGICFGLTSHNKHTSFLLSKEAQAASPRLRVEKTCKNQGKTCITQMANLTDTCFQNLFTANNSFTRLMETLPGPKTVSHDNEVTKGHDCLTANYGSTIRTSTPVVQIQSRNPNPESKNVSPAVNLILKHQIPFPSREMMKGEAFYVRRKQDAFLDLDDDTTSPEVDPTYSDPEGTFSSRKKPFLNNEPPTSIQVKEIYGYRQILQEISQKRTRENGVM
ncbi:hypothetical protein Tco_0309183 [Tanacetum coccineum]